MARQKKALARFEIDFKFPERTRDMLFKEDGTNLYTVEQLFEYASIRTDDYSLNFLPSVQQYYKTHGSITSSQLWTLGNIAVFGSPVYLDFEQKFFAWYDSREDIQELYTEIAKISYWFYNKQGQHLSSQEAKDGGFHDRPDGWFMFDRIVSSWEGNRLRELKRDVVYDVGDLVVVRKPFVGSYLHDPCYGKVDVDTDRIGTVAENTEKIYNRSRGGKGSRLINVIWINTGETKAVPERIIKKHRMK